MDSVFIFISFPLYHERNIHSLICCAFVQIKLLLKEFHCSLRLYHTPLCKYNNYVTQIEANFTVLMKINNDYTQIFKEKQV